MLYDNELRVRLVPQLLVAQNRNLLQIFQKETEEEQAGFLLNHFRPVGSTVLDVGCGTGELARLMKRRQPGLDFILLNRSSAQLAMCPPQMQRVFADAHQIPLGDETVDNVMACYVMGHLRKEEALKEFMRVLRPGGVLFIYDLTGGEMPELDYVAREYEGALDVSAEVSSKKFLELMPDFHERYPKVKPVIVRMVK